MKSSLLQPIEKGASQTQGALRAPHILVVEDETLIRETLTLALEEQGYRVCAVADGKTALNRICTNQRQESFDLVILDLILPQLSGLDVCQALRSQGSNVPVLIVSAKSSEIDRVVGLEIGADDYLPKPFGIRELIARCHALLRHHPSVPVRPPRQVLRVKAVEMHLECHQVLVRGQEVLLSPKEYRLLELLMTYPGRIWSREQLIERVWNQDFVGDNKTVDVHIRWLREKLEVDPKKPEYLVTERGIGYRFG